jgi:2-amino-4-hydroxy-6-hydroxymethyldihydropteridine diphosphokinase
MVSVFGSQKIGIMIFLGLGGNLSCETYGSPRRTCGAALEILARRGVAIAAHSHWYESAPVPISDQPWFVNGVVNVETALSPEQLVKTVLEVEGELGRRRSVPNAARTIDIDVLAYDDQVVGGKPHTDVEIPHPRMHSRAFVLLPLADIAPEWVHPISRQHIRDLIDALPADQICREIPDGEGISGTEWHPEAA